MFLIEILFVIARRRRYKRNTPFVGFLDSLAALQRVRTAKAASCRSPKTGVNAISSILFAPDETMFAYSYRLQLTTLYLVQDLH